MKKHPPSFAVNLIVGVVVGLFLAAGYVFSVVVLGIGRQLYTGSEWINSLIASASGPMQLLSIAILYSIYGTFMGAAIGLVSYGLRRLLWSMDTAAGDETAAGDK